jgi:hypothetical protein
MHGPSIYGGKGIVLGLKEKVEFVQVIDSHWPITAQKFLNLFLSIP